MSLLFAALMFFPAGDFTELPKPTRFNTASGWVQVDSFIVEQEYGLLNSDWSWALRTTLWEGDLNQLADLIRLTGNDTTLIWTVEELEEAGLLFGGHVVTGIEEELPPTSTFEAWPNPWGTTLNIRSSDSGVLRLYSIVGVLVHAIPIRAGETVLTIHLPSGVYFAVFRGHTLKVVTIH